QLRGLGHEVHAPLDDDLGVGLGRLTGELERIADHVGDAMEDLGRHVVMREHDGVARPFKLIDGVNVGSESWPLDRRDDARYALVKMRGVTRDLRRVGEVRQKGRRLRPLLSQPLGRGYAVNRPHSLLSLMLKLSIYGSLKHPAQGRPSLFSV